MPTNPPGVQPDYSVVIPFYNESANAAALLAEVNATMQALRGRYEVLMVNDGSTDNTAEILAGVAARQPQCQLLDLRPNRGQAGALYHGLKAAAAPLVITMDGDGQNCPADIPGLLAGGTADMIVGIRQQRQDSWFRRNISRLANAVRSRILGDRMHDSGCALKVFRRESRRLIHSHPHAVFIHAGDGRGGGLSRGGNTRDGPARGGGKSNYGLQVFLWRPVLDLLGVWWFSQRRFREFYPAPIEPRKD